MGSSGRLECIEHSPALTPASGRVFKAPGVGGGGHVVGDEADEAPNHLAETPRQVHNLAVAVGSVELRGIEPLASSMRPRRSAN